MKIKLTELKNLTRRAILHYGYTEDEAKVMEEVMLYSQMRGGNQGVVKLIGVGIPRAEDTKEIIVVKETKVSAQIDGGKNHAMVVVNQAADLAIKKAKEIGMSVVGVKGINTSSGSLGYYTRKIAEAGLIGFAFAGSMETVSADGSFEPIFGTNPLSTGVPTSKAPLVLDMATAAMAFFGLVEAKTAGKSIPEGIAYDKEGNLTTDPAKAMDGALRPFDKSYKGAGLSMMIQVLTGPLIGAYFTGIGDVDNNWAGHLIMAIDPETFDGLEKLKTGVSQMIEKVKGTKRLPGVEEIYVPGERGDKKMEEVLKSGEIEIEENLYNSLKEVANR